MSYTLNNIVKSPFQGLNYSTVTSDYGNRSFWNAIAQRQENNFHNGIDLTSGTTIVAVAPGTVTATRNNIAGYTEQYSSGNYVTINHGNGIYTTYCHLVQGSVAVSVGQWVEAGTVLGTKGSTGWSTGPHLHFAVRVNGSYTDPKPYLLGQKPFPGDNGGTPTPTAPSTGKSIDEVAQEVIRGEWGNGQDRFNALDAAGYNSSEVQARVNAILKGEATPAPAPQPEQNTSFALGDRVLVLSGRATAGSDGSGSATAEYDGNVNDASNFKYITSTNPGAARPYHLSNGTTLGNGDRGWVSADQIRKA